MPLKQSKSKEAFQHNVRAEIGAGKPVKQALAIAYNTKRHSMKKYAKGGPVQGNLPHTPDEADYASEPSTSSYSMEAAEHLAAAIMQAKSYRQMAEGGLVNEEPVDGLGSDNDHYEGTGAEESDTMAEDEGFGNYSPAEGEVGDEDQMANRRKGRLDQIMAQVRDKHFGKI